MGGDSGKALEFERVSLPEYQHFDFLVISSRRRFISVVRKGFIIRALTSAGSSGLDFTSGELHWASYP
jgi:hypothetical protein